MVHAFRIMTVELLKMCLRYMEFFVECLCMFTCRNLTYFFAYAININCFLVVVYLTRNLELPKIW